MRVLVVVLALAALPVPAAAWQLTESEICRLDYDPAFRDWRGIWYPKLQDGTVTRAQALRTHKRKWGPKVETAAWMPEVTRRCSKYPPLGKAEYLPRARGTAAATRSRR